MYLRSQMAHVRMLSFSAKMEAGIAIPTQPCSGFHLACQGYRHQAHMKQNWNGHCWQVRKFGRGSKVE